MHIHRGVEQPAEVLGHDGIRLFFVFFHRLHLYRHFGLGTRTGHTDPGSLYPRKFPQFPNQLVDISGIIVDIEHQEQAEEDDIFLGVPSLAHPGGDKSGETSLDAFGFLQLTFGLETAIVLDGFLPASGADSGDKLRKRNHAILLAFHILIVRAMCSFNWQLFHSRIVVRLMIELDK